MSLLHDILYITWSPIVTVRKRERRDSFKSRIHCVLGGLQLTLINHQSEIALSSRLLKPKGVLACAVYRPRTTIYLRGTYYS